MAKKALLQADLPRHVQFRLTKYGVISARWLSQLWRMSHTIISFKLVVIRFNLVKINTLGNRQDGFLTSKDATSPNRFYHTNLVIKKEALTY